jgi:Family of unknown function (DUF6152)
MKTKLFVLIGLLLAAPAFAHHGFAAEFDVTRPLKLKGTVVKWEVTNPHSWIHMDVKDDDNKTTTWMIEGGSPNNLYRLGFTKESLPAGAEIVVEGYRAKDGSTRAVGKNVTFSDGRRLFLGLQAPGTEEKK